MKMENLNPVHPGIVLLEKYLTPLNLSIKRFANETFIPLTRIYEIIRGRRRITADVALKFSRYFGNSAKFWLGLQDDYDLALEIARDNQELNQIESINQLLKAS